MIDNLKESSSAIGITRIIRDMGATHYKYLSKPAFDLWMIRWVVAVSASEYILLTSDCICC